jgi:hypothetical protein
VFDSLLFLGIVDIEVDCRKAVVCSYERERGVGETEQERARAGERAR